MNALEPVATLERTKEVSAAARSSARSRPFTTLYVTLTLRIVALCFCLLTFAQLASALRSTRASASSGVVRYEFTHFPYEEVGSNAAGAFSPSVLRSGKIRVSVAPRPSPGRVRMVLGAFVRSQPTTPVRFRIPPRSSDDDH
jgi:hypothetical protein